MFNQSIFQILEQLENLELDSNHIKETLLPKVEKQLGLTKGINDNFIRFISHDCHIKYYPNLYEGDTKGDYLIKDMGHLIKNSLQTS